MALIRPVDDTIVAFLLVDACDTVFSKDEQMLVCTSAYDEAFEKNSNIPLSILILFNPCLRVGTPETNKDFKALGIVPFFTKSA